MPESLGTAHTAKLTVTNTKETTVYLEKKAPPTGIYYAISDY